MKKYYIVFLAIITFLFLVSCDQDEPELLIMVPSGTPSLIIANSNGKNKVENYKLKNEIINGTDPLIAAFASKSHDIIFAPTNLGASIYNKNSNYILIGIVIWGNNYIVSNLDQNIKEVKDLKNKRILGFGKMSTPDAILQIILSYYELIDTVSIEYAPDVTTSTYYFLNGLESIVMTAEPLLSKVVNNLEVSVIDMQKEWEKITSYNGYPQVGVFVKKDHQNNKSLINGYLSLINQEILLMNSDAKKYSKIAIAADESFLAIGQEAIEKSIPKSNYRLEDIRDAKAAIEYYFNVLLNYNPNLIGGKMPDEEFYWKE